MKQSLPVPVNLRHVNGLFQQESPSPEGAGMQDPQDSGFVSVAGRVRDGLTRASASERRIARALLASYPSAGLDTASSLGTQANVSTATVVRYVASLGYASFREFQDALRAELALRSFSPLTGQPEDASGSRAGEDLRTSAGRLLGRQVENSLDALPEDELQAAVTLLTDPRLRITSFGGRFSYVLAHYLDLHLRLLRPGTRTLDVQPSVTAPFLADLGRRDVCVVFDVRRYQRDIVELARQSKRRGATVVLFTDPWLSPVAEVADVVLPSRVEGASPFDSLVPATAVVETVLAGVLERLGPQATARMEAIDLTFQGATTD
jgi:DNA-binding MurR/RpiR family transcriptional regulator